MPRPKFKNPQEEFDYGLKQIAFNVKGDNAQLLKARLLALLAWGRRMGLDTGSINKEDLDEKIGIAPAVPEESKPAEQKSIGNILEEIEGRK